MILPDALKGFTRHRQFITYMAQPHETIPGKLVKRPTNWATGAIHDANDPAVWTDYDTAVLHGAVGYVFADSDPFFFLDIDNCLQPDNTWSPLAQKLVSMLPGAAVEVSIGGKGLHVFGVGTLPRHASRNIPLGIELYHTNRFVAIGNGAVGEAMTDCTAGISQVIAEYFPRTAPDVTPANWTDAPMAGWNGPTDDDDLIRRACESKSASNAFGNKASFTDLWDMNAAALGRAFPDDTRPFDASAADSALAMHLAFWTGNDCARVERLMRKSKLARPKWDEHKNYLKGRTILNTVAMQSNVLADKLPQSSAPVTETEAVTGDTYVHPDQLAAMFQGYTYIQDTHTILSPDGHSLSQARFDAMHGGFTYVLDRSTGKSAKGAWEAILQSRDVRFPKVHGSEFAPWRKPGERWHDAGLEYVNSYVAIKTRAMKGNAGPFLEHLSRILPEEGDREIILSYMAAIIQYPGVKFKWCPLIQGAEGNGKTLLTRCIVEAVGRRHCHMPKPLELASKFNDWLAGKIFVGIEDILPGDRNEIVDSLSAMIRGEYVEIEGKGQDKVTRRICANFMLNCNPKDSIRKTVNGRLFAIFYTAQQSKKDIDKAGMGGDYFVNLYNWLQRDGYAIVTDYLRTYTIKDALNPATDCNRAPLTSTTKDAIVASAGRLEQEIQECIELDLVGFRAGWVSGHYLDLLITKMGLDKQYPRNKRDDLMLDVGGFFRHPGLGPTGRTPMAVAPDGIRSKLYIMPGHPCEYWDRQGDIARRYEADQAQPAFLLRSVV